MITNYKYFYFCFFKILLGVMIMKELQIQDTHSIRGGCCCWCKPCKPTNPGGNTDVVTPPPSKQCS